MIDGYINLQLFADDSKTEKATPKRREDARKKGQVLYSREMASALVLVAVFLGAKLLGGQAYYEMASYAKKVFAEYLGTNMLSINELMKMFTECLFVFLKAAVPVFGIATVIGLVAGYSQVGFLFTTEGISMRFNRINPISGFRRIFSSKALVELIKSALKITVIGYTAYRYLKGEAGNILQLMSLSTAGILTYIANLILNVAFRICIALILLGLLDYLYQWWEYEKSLRMSKQEVKEEFKQIEGNPEIKSRIKQKQRQISMRRMMQEVPKADVVITNPTHYAVAIKYDAEVSDAPVVLAKGQDYIALRIRKAAEENNVEIVENKPLAKALYETVDVGEAIPPELYEAVAEVLAFVYTLKGKGPA